MESKKKSKRLNYQYDFLKRTTEKNISDEEIKRNLALSKDCIIVFDELGRIVLFNEAAAKCFSFLTDKVIGQPIGKLLSLQTMSHKRLFCKAIQYFSQAAKGIPQQFQWVEKKAKKPIEAYDISLNSVILDNSRVTIAQYIDILEAKTLEWVLKSLAEINKHTGLDDLIDEITKLSATIFQAEHAVVNLIDDNEMAHTVCHFYEGKKQSNFSYPLANTPCGEVHHKKKICQFNGNVQVKFPDNTLLKELKIKAYLGGPLLNSEDKVAGLLIIMSKNKIKPNSLYKSIFQLLVARISLEIGRLLANRKLQFLASFPEQDPNPIIRVTNNGTILYSNQSGSLLLSRWSKKSKKLPPKLMEACKRMEKDVAFIREEVEIDGLVYLFTLRWLEDFSQINIYATDISELKSSQKKMRHLANYDRLTQVANRSFYETTLTRQITEAKKNNRQLALLLIDLDNFKSVNDTLGHHIGDHLLKVLAKRITGCLRRTDFIARLGGDEFVVLLKVVKPEEIALIADKINAAVATPFELGEYHIETACSIGISFYPENGTTNSELLKSADIAMYQAKKNGGDKSIVFSNYKHFGQSKRRTLIKRELKSPEIAKQLYMDYQPQFDLGSAKIVGFEAFLRWRHPSRGLISPAEFIPLAEQTGSIYTIGYWSIKQALEDYKKTMSSINNSKLSLNITLAQLNDQHFIALLNENLARLNLEKNLVVLDIREQISTVQYRHLNEHLQSLHIQGIRLSLDDYGGAQSSLSHLLEIPVDIVKIDHTYLHSLQDKPRNKAFISGIIDLANHMRLQVIQKGVENEEQNKLLKSLGCQYAQGFYYCPPMPISELQNYLRKYPKFH